MIRITHENFDLEEEFKLISSKDNGAYSFFLGTVRKEIKEFNEEIDSIFLECYKELAIQQLSLIREQSMKKWNLNECLIIHRIGKLLLGEKIVLIITGSSHRSEAINACEFIIDNLKVNVAMWKFNINRDQEFPVKFKEKDLDKFLKWSEVIKT